ncbi:MAG: arylsulfotransferase family protein [Acidobacteriota bacterium]
MAVAALFAFGALTASAEANGKKPVSVFPAPKTQVASDDTGFSFRGIKPKNMGPIEVRDRDGNRIGGKRLAHSDGKGVSFIPNGKFEPGEKVRVKTKRGIMLAKNGNFWVRIGRFYGNDDEQAPPGTPPVTDGLKSRPELKPVGLEVSVNKPEASKDKVFFAPKRGGLTIADKSGRVRWFRPAGFGGKGTQVYNFQTQTYRDRPVLTYWKGASTGRGFSQRGDNEILNNKYKKIATANPGNGYGANIHEFELTGRDTALVQAYRGVKYDLTPVGGPADGKIMDNIIQEVDIKTGAVLWEWHAVGNVGIKSSQTAPPEDGAVWDYFHTNAVKADGKGILVSGRRQSTVYRINRDNARVMWRLRGDGVKPKTSDFKIAPGAEWGYQHDMERLPNGDISLFDNGQDRPTTNVPVINEESSVLVLRLSGKGNNRKASLVKRYTHKPDHDAGSHGPGPLLAETQGSARLLENGNWFAGWGQVLQMTEFAPGGEIVWDATFPSTGQNTNSYRSFAAPWNGKPTDRPSIASEADGDGAKVYVSWNGSTKVQSWKVLTGATADSLTEVGSSNWKDLETMISVPTVDSKVRVVAYDGKGEKIGESGLIAVGQQAR